MSTRTTDGAEDLSAVVKAYIVGTDGAVVSSPNARSYDEELSLAYESSGAIVPRYEPFHCILLYEKSSALRPCVESYATNIDAFGFHLEPVIDLDVSNARDLVKTALRYQRMHDADPTEVTDEDVTSQMEVMRREAELEEFTLKNFFAYCCLDTSFVELRMETRTDLEITGNAYWEVVRNGAGRIQYIQRIDVSTMRIMPLSKQPVVTRTPQKISPITYASEPVPRKFRGFVQIIRGTVTAYFKQFGDPRVMSARTGRYYEDLAELARAEGDHAAAATEVIHHRVYAPLGPYGIPRWVGATMNIAGLRASEEVNYTYFDNKAVPPLALLVSGGTLKEGAADRVSQYIRENIKGRQNFHSILVLEAESAMAGTGARCQIQLQPLSAAQHTDALFQVYEANSNRKIGQQFRLPDLLRGASQEVNRAQAEAVLEMAEKQVFQPIRESFDNIMTRWVFADMGIRYWTFVSNSASAANAADLTELGTKWVQAGVLTPNEGRALASDAMNKDYKTLEEGWAQQPIPLTLAGILPMDLGAFGDDGSNNAPVAPGALGAPRAPNGLAQQVMVLEQALRTAAADGHSIQVQAAIRTANTHTIKVPNALWADLVDEEAR